MSDQPVIADAAECRRIALAAWDDHRRAVESRGDGDAFTRMRDPQPGDLVLELSTAFRWLGNDRLAPGEALGWLLRIEPDETYGKAYVLRPVYEPDGEFTWTNASFITVDRRHLPTSTPDA